jgi:hypothetical protein
MKLMIKDKEAEIGKVYFTIDDEEWKLLEIREPHKGSSTGRVVVTNGEWTREFFPSVIGGEWVGRKDQ